MPFFDSQGFSSGEHPWAGYTFEYAQSPAVPLPLHSWSKTTLLFVTGGQGSLEWKHRGIWNKDRMCGGIVSMVRRDVEIQAAVPTTSLPTMVLQLDNAKLEEGAEEYVAAIDKSLSPVKVAQDNRLALLLACMLEEVQAGCPSGRLYGEAMSLALLAYLAAHYATPRPTQTTGFSPTERRRVVEYVRANVGTNISVTELAGLVQMSASHFTRQFKAAFGMTPYQFVMHERIEAAKALFAGSNASAIEIAMTFGFSSQSHFSKVFRQFTGVTPKQYRAGF